ncbi:septal ring lytic transglycosylase RlpA family protein [Flavobacterium sp.]|uniref:septal ring lytic transglycosylase RlpA family protein n=1 Tax=Flavobacterium sp. TaxID=239 RepID=UPI00286E01ED|nr:septal ring lytic transglycosylase RlpA family protein [Flavobacterium sp.]
MKQKIGLLALVSLMCVMLFSFSFRTFEKQNFEQYNTIPDTVKVDSLALIDSLAIEKSYNYKLYKRNAHASYYANKFNGKKTASGARFDNNKLTAAHKKFAFGTKLRITNERNGKSVIVTINDRGPFVRGREIDLSRKAFMSVTSNKGGGVTMVKIEVQQKK